MRIALIVIAFLLTAAPAHAAVVDAPVLVKRPRISGERTAGQILTCSTGTWSGADAYSHRWTDQDGVELGTGATYTVAETDAGETIFCTVSAENAGGVTTAVASVWILLPPPVNTALPSIAGNPVPGSRLTCLPGTWTDGVWVQRVRWLRAGAEVSRRWSWTPQSADVGQSVRCEVTVSNGRTATALSAPVTVKAPPPPPPPVAPPVPATPAAAPLITPVAPTLTDINFARTAIVRSGVANVAFLSCQGACHATVSVRKGRRHLGRRSVRGTGSVWIRLKRVRRTTRATISVKVAGRTTTRRVRLRPR